MTQFPSFNPGDPLGKLTDHKLMNELFSAVSEASKTPIGRSQIGAGGIPFKPDLKNSSEPKLAKVIEVGSSSSAADFVGPSGGVDVIRVEFMDAVFPEVLGPQEVTQTDSSRRIAFAAAAPDQSLAVNDFVWVVNWSNQWWVVSGSGGAGDVEIKHGIVREICNQECGTYVVEIVNRSFVDDCAATGTGTGTA
jgi:hypothetical protein